MGMDAAVMRMLDRIGRLEQRLERLNGNEVLGGWTAFTPTLAQGAAVAATVSRARYQLLGRTAHIEVVLSVTGPGTALNNVGVIVPSFLAASNVVGMLAGTFTLLDVSAGWYQAVPTPNPGTTFYGFVAPGGSLGTVGFTAALASGDAIYLSAIYELA